jgi:transposase, IS5 family
MRFVGLRLGDRVPDAKTFWLSCEQLTRAGAIERLFGKFDTMLRDACSLFANVSNDSHPCDRI